ncbi:NAD(P)-dependent dehydrogenase (short-subunit alcohol dehydrogenase family) [Halopolyspora algeriensis]|uniref:NAD(P)-dependent dehydrogenase (Short-subunit alcohol dehydrogenase family) n=1 Tax=Halopolyspora algeriensis TaxID=1500506 RepID=A0A368VSW3_9ACTN|nr:SDR family NAD(P)-dependent oxidoreductase [Halopolyspora algeriensis]RCW45070.1 NAD(P)-dependent dehydrogenase (short-subunit alcohol dehydrogenase family) [Halopolyspora algeriensis]TQM53205.1 NAD(P)-dependent dehydrogenase (short-subunit alcohol dehydrogenase family) [Halopolyspora algeriensis]
MTSADGQVVFITGSTSGLGRKLAERLASEGAGVVLHGRSSERCESTVQEIQEATGSDRLPYHVANLASLAEVRRLADEVREQHGRLDVLVNNAGAGGGPAEEGTREISEDGYELRFAINHLAHYLLTHRLLPLLRSSAPARVVNVASGAQEAIDFDDVQLERDYSSSRAYTQSKLAQVMFTFDLAEALNADEVTINSLHPASLMDTKMAQRWYGSAMTSVEEGVAATHRLVTDPELAGVTGRYFSGQQEARAHEQAYDAEARRRLRELSEQLTSQAVG